MVRFVLHRLISAGGVMLVAIFLIFVGVRALPGGPALALAGDNPDPAVIAQINQRLGLDRPLMAQFWTYLQQLLSGDLGTSSSTGVPVHELFALRLPVTMQIALAAIVVSMALGIPAGIVSAVRKGSRLDGVVSTLSLVGLSVPHFWLGMLGILFFSLTLGWLPSSGFVPLSEDPAGWLKSIIMPAIALGLGLAAVLMRQTRSAVLTQLGADYVRTAKAKGLSRAVQVRHAVRNSLTTVITVLGLQLGVLISGAVIIESVFVIPGFGKLMIDAITMRDYAVVQATILVTVLGYVVVNLVVDVLYAVANPRVRLAGD